MHQSNMSKTQETNSGYTTYTEYGIQNLSRKPEWNNHIPCPEKSATGEYILVATGKYCMTNGREYIALPSNTNLSDWRIKEKYNLI